MTISHHALMSKTHQWDRFAYIFPDGIAYNFKTRVKLGDNTTEIEAYGFVRKKINIHLRKFDDDNTKNVMPYVVRRVPTKAIETIQEINHYYDSNYEDSQLAKKEIRNESIALQLKDGTTLHTNILHGLTEYPNHFGCDIESCGWKGCQDLATFIEKNKTDFSNHRKHVAFDIDTTKENQQ